ncbi:hypothetical protein [Actinoplanes sp. NPDC051851]|uniref:hypothetical protein n=1 Tax=Actinoplanes sp. NPDC051851 TaxID=3154753 RepID=UPI003444B9FB
MLPEVVGTWVHVELPRLNRAILGAQAPPELLTERLRAELLPELPVVTRLDQRQACQLTVLLGLVGASVARHYQEHEPDGRDHPEHAFAGLLSGTDQIPFRAYFAALADHTGSGHCYRDGYASLVRWNVGRVRVRMGHETVAELPGAFEDGHVRTYTGAGSEERFFVLVKMGETVELAVNELLCPLTPEHASLASEEAIHNVRAATVLLTTLRGLMVDFAGLPPEEGMAPDHFLDVFRQFAVHWTLGDIPPSGALDPEALKRDFLLGIAYPEYEERARRLFPGLLTHEREEISDLMTMLPLPERLLGDFGLAAGGLHDADHGDLRRLVAHHPALVDWYRLLTAHARASGAHLMLSKRMLFNPQRLRDAAGLGDGRLVSNRSGTTGMTERYLDRLTRARKEHPLAPLGPVLRAEAVEGGVRFDRESAPVEVAVELLG